MANLEKVVINLSKWIGDGVMATPVVNSLLARGSRVHIICSEPQYRVLQGFKDTEGIEGVHVVTKGDIKFLYLDRIKTQWSVKRFLSLTHIDSAIDLMGRPRGLDAIPENVETIIRPADADTKRGVSRKYPIGENNGRAIQPFPEITKIHADGKKHQVDVYRVYMDYLGVPFVVNFDIRIPDDIARRCEERLAKIGYPNKPLVVIHPGSKIPSKRLPVNSIYRIIARLYMRHGDNVNIAITGAKEFTEDGSYDLMAFSRIMRLTSQNLRSLSIIDWVTETGPLDDVYLSRMAHVFIGGDSGPSHFACSRSEVHHKTNSRYPEKLQRGAACVLISGPTDPNIWRPYTPDLVVIRKDGLFSLEDLRRISRGSYNKEGNDGCFYGNDGLCKYYQWGRKYNSCPVGGCLESIDPMLTVRAVDNLLSAQIK